jgi:UDPglucose--hexose-1-phosphate uridylyltransferase
MTDDTHSDAFRLAHDPSTDRPILVAPSRRGRPLLTVSGRDGADGCPFCEGAEASTPAEVDAVRPTGSAPDSPGWRVRAFPNLYPACRWHEVIAEGPEHCTRPGELGAELWQDALAVYRRRMLHLETQPDVRLAFWFKNVGRAAGASIAHSHSQILGLPMMPPRLVEELMRSRHHGSLVAAELDRAAEEGRIIHASERYAVFSPRDPRLPFETWLAPLDPDDDFDDGSRDAEIGEALALMFRAFDRAFDGPALNAWLHRIPGEKFHWHFEAQPRTGQLAGLELGADMYINSMPAEESAERLRTALAD